MAKVKKKIKRFVKEFFKKFVNVGPYKKPPFRLVGSMLVHIRTPLPPFGLLVPRLFI